MYIYSRRYFGQSDATPPPASLAQQRTETITITSYAQAIADLQSAVGAKDNVKAVQIINALLNDPKLPNNAGTLFQPLKDILGKIQQNKEVGDDLAALAPLAEAEASARPEDRLVNEELLNQRLFNLKQEIDDFIAQSSKFKAIWTKIRGKEAEAYAPLQNDLDDIDRAVKSTPLTITGRANILRQFQPLQQSAVDAIGIAKGGLLRLAGYIVLGASTIAITNAAIGFGSSKAKEHAVKIHTKYIKKAKPEEKKERRRRRRRK